MVWRAVLRVGPTTPYPTLPSLPYQTPSLHSPNPLPCSSSRPLRSDPSISHQHPPPPPHPSTALTSHPFNYTKASLTKTPLRKSTTHRSFESNSPDVSRLCILGLSFLKCLHFSSNLNFFLIKASFNKRSFYVPPIYNETMLCSMSESHGFYGWQIVFVYSLSCYLILEFYQHLMFFL